MFINIGKEKPSMTKDGYYTSGEFAKKANVTLRTIRYYDKQGILKPSKIAGNGYRLYTQADFGKLQKILSLKYLGFSLEEIMAITINDEDQDFMKDSIDLQLDLVREKMNHLREVEQSLRETKKMIQNQKEVDWAQMLPLLHVTKMERSIVEQYKNSSNLDIRIHLHKKYSKNPVEWFPWIYQQLGIKENQNILELGCGTGELWKANQKNLPKNLQVVLSDQSEGMIRDAKRAIGTDDRFSYQVFHCEEIPYEENSFDCVIANHLLFYIKDRKRVYDQVNRVLKKEGIFACSTYGKEHMKEITNLVREFDDRINLSAEALYDVFGLESGKAELEKNFSQVKEVRYEDYLLVDQAEPLISYIISCHGNQQEYLSRRYLEFKEFVQEKMKQEGEMKITKAAGIFICQ